MARYLLDTNTCIAAMRNQATVVQRMAALAPADCVISTIASYELFTGVEKCANPAQERAKVELLLKTIVELPFDSAAAKEAGRIRAILEAKGQPIGPYDLLLAGQAVALSMTLVTANTKEFSRVPGLVTENWQV
ncbi:MAG TPA: type II toxin-antitoxin system VapC family toxin [Gemmataceae bacterium]|nr:type II toxin-antitoxin system VapC family toxin [Gemmataceae bacterium]